MEFKLADFQILFLIQNNGMKKIKVSKKNYLLFIKGSYQQIKSTSIPHKFQH